MRELPITGPDRYYYPVTIFNGTVAITEGGTTRSETVSVGDWFVHLGDGSGSFDAGLLSAIETAVNTAAVDNTYEVQAQTPTGYPIDQCGVRLERVSGSANFGWDFTATGSIPPEIVGYQPSATNPTTTTGTLESPRSAIGIWDPHNAFSSGDTPWSRSYSEQKILEESSSDITRAHQVQLGEVQHTRTVEYEAIRDAFVYRGLADDADYADPAGLPLGDDHNCWQRFWERASQHEQFIATYNNARGGLDPDGETWERVKMTDIEQRSSLEECLEARDDIPAARDITVDLKIEGASYAA